MAGLSAVCPQTFRDNAIVLCVLDYLGEEDIACFRLTCRSVYELGERHHLNAIYQVHKLFTRCARSLDNFARIARRPELNSRVRHVRLYVCSPYSSGRFIPNRMCPETYSHYGAGWDMFMHAPTDVEMRQLPADAFQTIEGMRKDYRAMEGKKREKDALNLKRLGRRLRSAFKKFPSIETLRFEPVSDDLGFATVPLSRVDINLFYPSANLCPGTHIPEALLNPNRLQISTDDGDSDSFNDFWSAAAGAIVNAPQLSSLRVIRFESFCDGISAKWFKQQQSKLDIYRTAFPKLRELGITAWNDFMNPGIFEVGDARDSAVTVWRWIEAIGSSHLEVVRLALNSDRQNPNLFRLIHLPPTTVAFPCLKQLLLRGFDLSPDFVESLLRQAPAVKALLIQAIFHIDAREKKKAQADSLIRLVNFLRAERRNIRVIHLAMRCSLNWAGGEDHSQSTPQKTIYYGQTFCPPLRLNILCGCRMSSTKSIPGGYMWIEVKCDALRAKPHIYKPVLRLIWSWLGVEGVSTEVDETLLNGHCRLYQRFMLESL
ncbi:hypothetical protein TWF696_005563 [Orbilia brochopaga]|uniref:F-box domain-containing protein n=1 Tax=Orbilia brochopaga TaxID=3140254 RepID=A0AAV9V469_9PEZI